MTPFRHAGRPLAVLAALVLSLLSACQREKDTAPAASQPLSIEEARTWFDSHLGNVPAASPGGRTAKKPAREPDWPYAYKQKVKDKEMVVVPLKLEKGYRSKGYLGKLLMFKDAQGNVQTQVVKASGTKAFLEKNNYNVHGEGFSGIVRVEDWDGKLIDGEYYDNGKVVGRVVEGTASKGGRTQGYIITVVVSFYQQVCMGGDCGGWSYLDSQVKTIWVSDGYSPSYYYGTYYFASGSGGGSYGGGGSTSTRCPYGPNCNEPVPFDEMTFDVEVVQPVPNNYDEELGIGIDCGSFAFSQTGTNWQEAGVRNQRIKIVWLTAQGRFERVVTITGDMVIGLPLQRNGQTISSGAAAEIAKEIVDAAFIQTAQYITSMYGHTEPDATIQLYFRSVASTIAASRGGEATYSGRGTANIITREAKYVWVDALNNCN